MVTASRHFLVRHKNEVRSATGKCTYTATYAHDTVILSCHGNKNTASHRLQLNPNDIDIWLRKWRIKPNVLKSVQITFTLKKDLCPQVFLDNANLPQVTMLKYLGLPVDSRLTVSLTVKTVVLPGKHIS